MLGSQVEAVGRHWQSQLQKYLNFMVILSGKPKGGTCSKPLINFSIWLMAIWPFSPVEIQIIRNISEQNQEYSVSYLWHKINIEKINKTWYFKGCLQSMIIIIYCFVFSNNCSWGTGLQILCFVTLKNKFILRAFTHFLFHCNPLWSHGSI